VRGGRGKRRSWTSGVRGFGTSIIAAMSKRHDLGVVYQERLSEQVRSTVETEANHMLAD
jgi:hypothetical protein